jgi:hypothetical protein
MDTTSFRIEFNVEMRRLGESWADVISCTLTEQELDNRFVLSAIDPFPKFRGHSPYLWTKERVYFLMQDGDYNWIESAPRNPPPPKPVRIPSELEQEINRVVEQAGSKLWADDAWLEWAAAWLEEPEARSISTCYAQSMRLITWRVHERVQNDQDMFKWWVVRCATSAALAFLQGNEANARSFIAAADYWAGYIRT